MTKNLILSLICGLTVFSGAARAESEEALARRAERIVKSMRVLPDNAQAAIPYGTLVVYRRAGETKLGAAARLTRVVRYKHYLFIYNEFDNGPKVIPYRSDTSAQYDLEDLERGNHIDVSRCMESDRILTSERLGPGCTAKTFTVQMNCGVTTRVPLIESLDASRYEQVDIEANPLVDSSLHCPMEKN